jgi:hypothetical protein
MSTRAKFCHGVLFSLELNFGLNTDLTALFVDYIVSPSAT